MIFTYLACKYWFLSMWTDWQKIAYHHATFFNLYSNKEMLTTFANKLWYRFQRIARLGLFLFISAFPIVIALIFLLNLYKNTGKWDMQEMEIN